MFDHFHSVVESHLLTRHKSIDTWCQQPSPIPPPTPVPCLGTYLGYSKSFGIVRLPQQHPSPLSQGVGARAGLSFGKYLRRFGGPGKISSKVWRLWKLSKTPSKVSENIFESFGNIFENLETLEKSSKVWRLWKTFKTPSKFREKNLRKFGDSGNIFFLPFVHSSPPEPQRTELNPQWGRM